MMLMIRDARKGGSRNIISMQTCILPTQVGAKKKALSIFLEIDSHAVRVPQEAGRTWINTETVGQAQT